MCPQADCFGEREFPGINREFKEMGPQADLCGYTAIIHTFYIFSGVHQVTQVLHTLSIIIGVHQAEASAEN